MFCCRTVDCKCALNSLHYLTSVTFLLFEMTFGRFVEVAINLDSMNLLWGLLQIPLTGQEYLVLMKRENNLRNLLEEKTELGKLEDLNCPDLDLLILALQFAVNSVDLEEILSFLIRRGCLGLPGA